MNYIYVTLIIIGFALIGYIFGSIPFGVIIGKLYHKDPRQYGSKNTGGTNVGRVVSRFAGCLTIVLDALKILLPFIGVFILVTYQDDVRNFLSLGSDFNQYYWWGRGNSLVSLSYYIVLLFGFIGHTYSIFLKFKGGKMVSTYVALIFGTTVFGIVFPIIFLTVLKIKKYVSLSSITMAISFALFSWIVYIIYLATGLNYEVTSYLMWFDFGPSISIYFPIFATLGSALLVYKHKDNIKRLKEGTESKVVWIDEMFSKKKNRD